MAAPLETLGETIDRVMAALCITQWHNEPVPGVRGYRVAVRFHCTVCDARWWERVWNGDTFHVVQDLAAMRDAHRCDLTLGPAGRTTHALPAREEA